MATAEVISHNEPYLMKAECFQTAGIRSRIKRIFPFIVGTCCRVVLLGGTSAILRRSFMSAHLNVISVSDFMLMLLASVFIAVNRHFLFIFFVHNKTFKKHLCNKDIKYMFTWTVPAYLHARVQR